jgi:hypothetical protein
MKIDRILAGIRESQAAEKQASEAPAPAASSTEKVASTQTALVSAMKDALAPTEKTASEKKPEASPVDDVMKVAEELAGAEKEAALKEAQILGTAFADAAIARMSEWNKTAGQMLAAAPTAPAVSSTTDFGKFAQQNPDLVKQAAQIGYEKAKADLEKQAEDSYVQGYNDTVETIHKTAALEFLKAAAVTAQIVENSVNR